LLHLLLIENAIDMTLNLIILIILMNIQMVILIILNRCKSFYRFFAIFLNIIIIIKIIQ